MQSIISNNGFGFCKASGFRNCNNCLYRLKCINYAPVYALDSAQFNLSESRSLQNEKNLVNNIEPLMAENALLKQKIQDLENQILELNNSKNIQEATNKVVNEEVKSSSLQVYENKNLELSQQEQIPLKSKKGIFGTKFVEDKPNKK